MGIFDKFKKQDSHLSEEEKEKLDYLVYPDEEETKNTSSAQKESFDIFSHIRGISSIHEINKIRNMLDEQEKYLSGKSTEETTTKNYKSSQEQEDYPSIETQEIDEQEEEEPPKKQETPEVKLEEVQTYKEIEEEPLVKEEEEEDKNQPQHTSSIEDEFETQTSLFYDKVKNLFGEENMFYRSEEESQLNILKGKKVFQIGLRQKSAFGEDNTKEENSWFVTTIKQLDELKNFKMMRSEEGIKDLVWDKGDYAILISFRATSLLSSTDEFDFDS